MADESLIEKVHDLSDLELAILLCLIAREHCLISTPDHVLSDLVEELRLVASRTFGLSSIVIDCTPRTTLDDFASGLLIHSHNSRSTASSPLTTRSDSYFSPSHNSSSSHRRPSHPLQQLARANTSSQRIANFVIARNFDRAPSAVQIQALELLRTGRIFTRTSVQAVPKPFIFVPALAAASGGEARVARHLNDHFYVAHWHDPELGFVNLEEDADEGDGDDGNSVSSVVQKSSTPGGVGTQSPDVLITNEDIARLASLGQQVAVDIDVTRYRMNVVAFLRMHRAVADGISPMSVQHFDRLTRSLAPLHNLDYVTPALVDLAARRIFLHRIRITTPEMERSVQWGSKLETVRSVLEHVGPEEVIEDVLTMVAAPL